VGLGSRAGSWDSGIPCFRLNSRVLTFLSNVTFLRKFHRIRVLECALGIHGGHYS